MSHFDDLPSRHRSHVTEDEALSAFQSRLLECNAFILQSADRKDYGVDCQIEVLNQGSVSNVRIYVQLKGTERSLNSDGSVSIDIARTNFNYLLAQPYSFYACYHLPTRSLRICFVEDVLRQYEHSKKNWTTQQTLTVSLSEELTVDRLTALASLARTGSVMSRDRRANQVKSPNSEIPGLLRKQTLDLFIPANSKEAVGILSSLYERGDDETISANFGRFAAVIGIDNDEFGYCYMAEINLGMSKRSGSPGRLEEALNFFRSRLASGRYQYGSLLYTIGNACSALGEENEAKDFYEAALRDTVFISAPEMAAQVHKNLGTSIERLNDPERAVVHYQEALRLNPSLTEAHNALGNYYTKIGRYHDALHHFDSIVFMEHELGAALAVSGWRVNVLFNLEDGRGAFREINSLIRHADDAPWIWPWCATQVASFGRTSVNNARLAIGFWQRFSKAFPGSSDAIREVLLVKFYLRSEDTDYSPSYDHFLNEFEEGIASISEEDDLAFLWDRLGHWAQDEDNWAEAERCYRKAFNLKGGHYGYCLGTALNFLGQHEEALPILLEQASSIQPDSMSWFQVAEAQAKIGQPAEAILSYRRALELDPNYDLAMFNLGGLYWNNGDFGEAIKIWKQAIELFPDHSLAAEVRRRIPFIFSSDK